MDILFQNSERIIRADSLRDFRIGQLVLVEGFYYNPEYGYRLRKQFGIVLGVRSIPQSSIPRGHHRDDLKPYGIKMYTQHGKTILETEFLPLYKKKRNKMTIIIPAAQKTFDTNKFFNNLHKRLNKPPFHQHYVNFAQAIRSYLALGKYAKYNVIKEKLYRSSMEGGTWQFDIKVIDYEGKKSENYPTAYDSIICAALFEHRTSFKHNFLYIEHKEKGELILRDPYCETNFLPVKSELDLFFQFETGLTENVDWFVKNIESFIEKVEKLL